MVTINTWKCDGDYRLRLRALTSQLKALQPSLIACQECFFSPGAADTLGFLASELQMESRFLPARPKKRLFENQWVDSWSGLGVLSIFPFGESHTFDLPNTQEDPDRKVQQLIVPLPGGTTLQLTHVHLTHLIHSPLQKMQFDALTKIVASQSADIHVLCGDWNTTIDSDLLTSFLKDTKSVDAYLAGGGREPRYSMRDEYLAEKMVCVDHMLLCPSAQPMPRCRDAAIVLHRKDETTGVYASDHFGISVTLSID